MEGGGAAGGATARCQGGTAAGRGPARDRAACERGAAAPPSSDAALPAAHRLRAFPARPSAPARSSADVPPSAARTPACRRGETRWRGGAASTASRSRRRSGAGTTRPAALGQAVMPARPPERCHTGRRRRSRRSGSPVQHAHRASAGRRLRRAARPDMLWSKRGCASQGRTCIWYGFSTACCSCSCSTVPPTCSETTCLYPAAPFPSSSALASRSASACNRKSRSPCARNQRACRWACTGRARVVGQHYQHTLCGPWS